MTNDLEKANMTDRIARFQSINAGMYWRALEDIPEFAIKEGMVLLIESIRYVDGSPHTIIVRAHPDNYGKSLRVTVTKEDGTETTRHLDCKTHRFLTETFLEKFEYEPDHEAIRQRETAAIQAEITGLQTELAQTQSDPARMAQIVDEKLREEAEKKQSEDGEEEATENLPALPPSALATAAKGSLADVLGSGITEAKVGALKAAAEQEHKVATIQSKWLESKTAEITGKIVALTPYYKEQAAAALARTNDVREYVDKLMKGIESLDLYTGTDVHVDTIATGKSAPGDVPLTCVQRKLQMDEELAVWEDVEESFDHRSQKVFFKALNEQPDFVNQVFPTERCIVLMNATSRLIDYGDPILSNIHNRENRVVFLMVRDGENIYRVVSSVESHLGAGRLFPAKDENDRIFKGFDGSRITLQDVTYTDKLARHEDAVLHYKRFLILLCGLDHRLDLFGPFYDGPKDFHFVSPEFQEKHLRFLHDDDGEGMLPEEQRPSFEQYINTLNGATQSGSRVLCIWRELMNPKTAPSCCPEYGYGSQHGYDWQYKPDNEHDVCIVQRSGQDLFVKIGVSGETREWKKREFDAKVTIRFGPSAERRYYRDDYEFNSLPFLCLDLADPDQLEWYIQNRRTRRFHLSYIKIFKRAVAMLRADRAKEKSTRDRMRSAVLENKIATPDAAGSIIDQAVATWRASNRGAALPDFENGEGSSRQWKALLDQMYLLAGASEERADALMEYAKEQGIVPLRISLSGNGVMLLYAAPSASERDDRAEPFVWVRRLMTKPSKTGVSVTSERWALLVKNPPGETVVREMDAAQDWIGKTSVFNSPMQKAQVFDRCSESTERLRPFTANALETDFEVELDRWDIERDRQMETSKYVTYPSLVVPIGVVVRDGEPHYVCISTTDPVGMLCRNASTSEIDRARALFVSVYQNKTRAKSQFEKQARSGTWELHIVPAQSVPKDWSNSYVPAVTWGNYSDRAANDEFDPRLSARLERLQKDNDIWVSLDAFSEGDALMADEYFGLSRPDGYDPVSTREVTISNSDGVTLGWIEIIQDTNEVETRIKPPEGYSMSAYSQGRYLNGDIAEEKATETIKNRSTVRLVDVPDVAFDVPDAPDGVRRIYFQGIS